MNLFKVLAKLNKKKSEVANDDLLFTLNAYKALFDNNDEAVFTMNIDGVVKLMNKAVSKLFGYTLKELDKGYETFIHADYVQMASYHFQKSFNGQTTRFQAVCLHKNGKEVDVNITCIPIKIDGVVVGAYGVISEIGFIIEQKKVLEETQHRFASAEHIANISSWVYDVKKSESFWSSDQIYSILNIEKDTKHFYSFKDYRPFIHPNDRKSHEDKFKQAMTDGEGYSYEYRIVRPNGEERIVVDHVVVTLDENRKPSRLEGVIQDITVSRNLLEGLEERDSQVKNLANNLDVGIWSIDKITNKWLFCSKGVKEIYGASAAYFTDDPLLWKSFIHKEDRAKVDAMEAEIIRGNRMRYQYRIIDKTGQLKWIDECAIPVIDEKGQLIRLDGIISDITNQKEQTDALNFFANHDYLTRLPNGRFFQKQLEELITESAEKSEKFAVFSIDIDRFKYINDTLGREVGDKLLKHIANLLEVSSKKYAFLSRIGGNEFALFSQKITNVEESISIANKMIELFKRPIFIEEFEMFITASIGISFYPDDGEDAESLLNKAGVALQKVKERGKNDLQVYASTMNIQSFKSYELERDLRKAFIYNEFYCEYQPIVDAKTGKLKGAEALIRWNHPDWGRVAPNDFIPLAEEMGLILDIGDWVFEQVCMKLAKWKAQGLSLVPISVNISPKRLLKANFVERINEIIEKYKVDPSLLMFEMTEGSIIRDFEHTNSMITKLKHDGISFALDDFGTGFSSLSHLKDLDISTVKIDKSFVSEINQNPTSESIIKSIVYLAKELELDVIAEGVEHEYQLNFLKQLDCPHIQGYLYSQSLSVEEFERVIKLGILKPTQKRGKPMSLHNRRKYYRINFAYPSESKMTIVEFKGKKLSLGASNVLIEDISLGGLRYVDAIDLPVHPDIKLKFTLCLLDEEIEVSGFLTRKQEIDDNLFQYGIQFILTDAERNRLAALINQLDVQIRDNPLIKGCNFITKSRKMYFS
ncbi:EAL domain-containing protein [bacterium LRH843]|nr:EAL domain-containing protein [bacterium LRH843]